MGDSGARLGGVEALVLGHHHVCPLLLRALHGLDELVTESPAEAAIAADADLAPIRRPVALLLPPARGG